MNKEKILEVVFKNLDNILLDLKRGYSYVHSNFIIKEHLIDILLYNRLNQCFVLIYVKTDKITKNFIKEVKETIKAVNIESNTKDSVALIVTEKMNSITLNTNLINYIFY